MLVIYIPRGLLNNRTCLEMATGYRPTLNFERVDHRPACQAHPICPPSMRNHLAKIKNDGHDRPGVEPAWQHWRSGHATPRRWEVIFNKGELALLRRTAPRCRAAISSQTVRPRRQRDHGSLSAHRGDHGRRLAVGTVGGKQSCGSSRKVWNCGATVSSVDRRNDVALNLLPLASFEAGAAAAYPHDQSSADHPNCRRRLSHVRRGACRLRPRSSTLKDSCSMR